MVIGGGSVPEVVGGGVGEGAMVGDGGRSGGVVVTGGATGWGSLVCSSLEYWLRIS